MSVDPSAYKWLPQINFLCPVCDADLSRVPWDVDHKQPSSRAGTDDPVNLHILCAHCNRTKHAKTMEEFVALRLSRGLYVSTRAMLKWGDGSVATADGSTHDHSIQKKKRKRGRRGGAFRKSSKYHLAVT